MRSRPLLAIAGRTAACLLLLNVATPLGAVATIGTPIREGLEARADRAKAEAAEAAGREKRRVHSRPLTAKEQRTEQGRSGPNPYLAGQSKWDVVYKGVNLMTGAYTSGGTDLSFDGGYGIPVNVTRSYNSNTVDEGPFGRGWTLSADVRSTAGGMLKSPGAPVRSVPSSFKERPSAELDPNLPMTGQGSQPAEAVVATDASGEEETIQKDADGVLTTPPWDKNVIDSKYETLTDSNGAVYQLLIENTVKTADGTVYRYTKQGAYTNGTKPWNNSTATAEPANVLKVVEATDRQGNLTTYTYGSGWVTFQKMNGQTQEHPLVKVEMPNGHKLDLAWGNGTTAPTNRVVDIDDGLANTSDRRHVLYAYDGSGNLAKVTTPGGKETTYGYSGSYLTSITDPRGFVEGIVYDDAYITNLPWGGYAAVTAVKQLNHANGTWTDILYNPDGSNVSVAERQDFYILSIFGLNFATGTGSQPSVKVEASTSKGSLWYENKWNVPPSHTAKTYGVFTQDLIEQVDDWVSTTRYVIDDPYETSSLDDPVYYATKVTSAYNFQGQPLSQTVREIGPCATDSARNAANAGTATTVQYAYWGKDKYWQRKAVRDHADRYSFTDYYDASAANGRKGQTKEVYDEKYSNFAENTNIAVPAGAATTWPYRIEPTTGSIPVAKFDYDSKGRSIWADKLRSVSGSTGTYVRTTTSYGADTDGSWGQPNVVTEDAGGIGRTTETKQYNAQGKATIVKDARGNGFQTHYLPDGEVDWVKQVNPATFAFVRDVATYAYGLKPGTGGPANTPENWAAYGQLVSVTDNLSNVTQAFQYGTAYGAKGQVTKVSESDPTDTSGAWNGIAVPAVVMDYTYWPSGDRATSMSTVDGQLSEFWQYDEYRPVGEPTGQSRVFRVMRKLTPSGAYTPEEEQFAYDERGRLVAAAFAQTPALNSQSQTYETNGASPYYAWGGGNLMASARCIAYYNRDAAGRVLNLAHYWENRSASGALSTYAINGETNTYATSGATKGLKTASATLAGVANSTSFTTSRSDTYGYDADRGYLASWTPSDGAAKTWTYDTAGNRAGGTYDALNRQTALGSTTYGVDIAGNRTSKVSSGTISYGWDPLNRMDSVTRNGSVYGFQYRADGLRSAQVYNGSGTSQNRITTWAYDGQMPVAEIYRLGTAVTKTRWAVGPRGTERQEVVTASSTNVSYPLYDGHGNQTAMIRRDPNVPGGYLKADDRIYDPWGNVRSGDSANPVQGYCGSLGHRRDDDLGFVYMRARYYDPQCGRFISQDPALNGSNWFAYCSNDPVNRFDASGKSDEDIAELGKILVDYSLLLFTIGQGRLIAGAWSMRAGAIAYTTKTFDNLLTMQVALISKCAGMAMMLYGALAATTGAKRIAGGLLVGYAGDILMALGEDGLEYAATLLDAASQQFGIETAVWL